MLSKIKIENYALIDTLHIDFEKNFTVITGETGAGKSILLGAISLITGKRADVQTLNDKSKKCIIEGTFNISNYNLHNFFEKNDLDYEEETTLRREITAKGKSRAFINDTPANLAQLKELSEYLIDIHSQHQTLLLNTNEFQFSVLDAFAKQLPQLKSYQLEFNNLSNLKEELFALQEEEKKAAIDTNYFQFQLEEFGEAELKKKEQETLENELKTLQNAEEIKLKLYSASNALSNEENGIINQLKEVEFSLNQLKDFNENLHKIAERIESNIIETQDIAYEIDQIQDTITHDTERIEILNARLDLIYSLQHKHNVATIEQLLEIEQNLIEKINGISSLSSQITDLQRKVKNQEQKTLKIAQSISKNRLKFAPVLEKEIRKILANLSMFNAQIKINIQPLKELNKNGLDTIKFLFSANKGGVLSELSKVASGGELSRLMLSIKAIISKYSALPSIIFDEIDTGVSGEVADKMGQIMKAMGQEMQVISITHLPQIAGKGDAHLFVYKTDVKQITQTKIKHLSNEERVDEVAKMLSGTTTTNAAIKNAKELLNC